MKIILSATETKIYTNSLNLSDDIEGFMMKQYIMYGILAMHNMFPTVDWRVVKEERIEDKITLTLYGVITMGEYVSTF